MPKGGSTRVSTSKWKPQDEDEDIPEDEIWTALGIVAEDKKRYKVRWGDLDENGNPYPNSWTRKIDVSGDLIEDWLRIPEDERRRLSEEEARLEKEEKKRAAREARKTKSASARRGSTSTKSGRDSTSIVVTSRKRIENQGAYSESISNYKALPESVSVSPPKGTSKSQAKSKAKKRSYDEDVYSDDQGLANSANHPTTSNGSHPTAKKQKLTHNVVVELGDDGRELSEAQTSEEEVAAAISPKRKSMPKTRLSDGTANPARRPVRVGREPPLDDSGDDEPLAIDQSSTRSFKVGPPKKLTKAQKKDVQQTVSSRPRGASSVLSPDAARRLEQFDAEMKVLEQETEGSERSVGPPIIYAESDVDTDAAELMYPPEAGMPRRKGKQKRKVPYEGTDAEDEVPETQSPNARHLTPMKPSLISKMKPRTPLSASGSKLSVVDDDFDIQPGELLGQLPLPKSPSRGSAATAKPNNNHLKKPKVMGPIPVISPSKFTPHLPSYNSTIENPEDSQAPPSSAEQIEEFESPEKRSGPERVVLRQPANAKKGARVEKEVDLPYWSGDAVLAKGQEIAARSKASTRIPQGPRPTLEEIQQRVRAASRTKSPEAPDEDREEFQLDSQSSPFAPNDAPTPTQWTQNCEEEEEEEEPVALEEEEEEEGLEYVDEPQPPIMELEDSFDEQQVQGTLETMTQEDVSMMDAPRPPPEAVPEEEEESTQDLLAELEVQEAISNPGSLSPSPEPPTINPVSMAVPQAQPEPNQRQTSEEVQHDADVSMIPQPGTQARSQDAGEVPQPPPPLPTRARSRSEAPSVKPSQEEVQDSSQEIPATSSANPDSQETNGSAKSNLHPDHHDEEIKKALALLNVKSEEIARLERSLAEEKLKVEDMAQRLDSSSREWMTRLESDLAQLKLDHEEERSKWAEEKFTLEVALKSAVDRKTLAENDCERFKGEYMRVSGTVGQLRSEKRELEEELAIAQKQATEGVAAVKALLQGRIDELTRQRDYHKECADWSRKMERLTNDNIRKSAAEAPEWKDKYQRFKKLHKALEVELDNKENEHKLLKEELEQEKQENETLRARLRLLEANGSASAYSSPSQRRQQDGAAASTLTVNRIVIETRQVAPVGDSSSEDEDEDDIEDDDAQVYRCQWRSKSGNTCNCLFASMDDLLKHMVSDEDHIPISSNMDGLD